MKSNTFFIALYFIGYFVFPPDLELGLLIIQCLIGLYSDIKTNSASLITIVYLGTIMSTVGNISLISKADFSTDSIYSYMIPENIPKAALIWCVGNSSLFLGYNLFIKKTFPRIDINVSALSIDKVFYFSLLMLFLGLTQTGVNLVFLGGGVLKVLGLVNLIGILIFARLWKMYNNKKYRNYAFIAFLGQMYLALTHAYLRQEILYPVISLMGGYFLGLGKVKYLFSYRIIPYALYFLLFIFSFKKLERSNLLGSLTKAVFSSNSSTSSTEQDSDVEQISNSEKGTVLDRVSNLAQITNCIKLVNADGYYYGKASAPLLAAVVPRFLWHDKPPVRLGAWFATAIGSAYVNDEGKANNSVNMTVPGELYIDFGLIGVIFGCVILGGLLAMFWNSAHFNDSAFNLTGTMWGGYLLQSGISGYNGGDLQIIITMFSTYLTFYVIKLIFREK